MNKKIFAGSSLFFVLMMYGCAMPEQIRQHEEFIREQVLTNPGLESNFLEFENLQLHYMTLGKPDQSIIVWIHGTPGSWKHAGKLMVYEELLTRNLLVAIDRPGWGDSQLIQDKAMSLAAFSEQQRYIGELLRVLKTNYPNTKLILAGHSWGASIAPYLAMETPESVDALLLLAGGLDPELTGPRWYNRIANTWVINNLLPEQLRAANEEVYVLQDELSAMASRWSELNIPVIVIQGEEDRLVHPDNAGFAELNLDESHALIIRLEGQGHLLQIDRMDLVARCIDALSIGQLALCDVTDP